MVNHNKKPRIKRGSYELRMHPGGGFTAFGPGLRERGTYCPNKTKIIDRVNRELERGGKLSKTSINWLALRGLTSQEEKLSVIAGKRVLGIKRKLPYWPVPDEEIEEAIRDFWSKEELEAARRGEPIDIDNLTAFGRENSRTYRAALARPGRFKGYFERIYPGCYDVVVGKIDPQSVDIGEVREELKRRINLGLPVSKAALLSSRERAAKRLYNQINALLKNTKRVPQGQQNLFGDREQKHYTFGQLIEKLVGKVSPVAKGAKKSINNLSEELVHVYLRWARLMGHRLPGLSSGEMHRPGAERHFTYTDARGNEKGAIADIRIGNQPIDIKSGLIKLSKEDSEGILDRYSLGKNRWDDGQPLEDSILIFHTVPSFYSKYIPQLKEAGITIRTYEWFTERLKAIVPEIRRNYGDAIENVRPRIGDLDFLLALNEELAFKPGLLMRKSNSERRESAWPTLRDLALKAQELQDVT